MFNWEGCPTGLFDVYIEVGDVKKSEFESNDCVFIEVWLSSFFARNRIREECKQSVRRPIYGVLKQIKELCGDKSANVLFMCDDMQNDTILWADAILLLLQELKKQKIAKHAILFARDSKEDTERFVQSARRHSDKSKENFLLLSDLLDAVIYGQSNCCLDSATACVHSKTNDLPEEMKNYIQFARKDG